MTKSNTVVSTINDVMTADFLDWLKTPEGGNASMVKDLGDGLWAATFPLLFHWTLKVGEMGNYETYLDRWCYADQKLAEEALTKWSGTGDPDGWHRHPASGRRRPDGDASKEHVNP